jgi:hypothetical protein
MKKLTFIFRCNTLTSNDLDGDRYRPQIFHSNGILKFELFQSVVRYEPEQLSLPFEVALLRLAIGVADTTSSFNAASVEVFHVKSFSFPHIINQRNNIAISSFRMSFASSNGVYARGPADFQSL